MKGVGQPRWCRVCEQLVMGQYLSDGDGQHLVCTKGHYLRIAETAEETLERLSASHEKYRAIALEAQRRQEHAEADRRRWEEEDRQRKEENQRYWEEQGKATQATATRQEPQSGEETEEAVEEPISPAELRWVRKERLENWSREAIDTTPDRFENADYHAATAELLLAIAANLELLRMGLEDGSYLSPC